MTRDRDKGRDTDNNRDEGQDKPYDKPPESRRANVANARFRKIANHDFGVVESVDFLLTFL